MDKLCLFWHKRLMGHLVDTDQNCGYSVSDKLIFGSDSFHDHCIEFPAICTSLSEQLARIAMFTVRTVRPPLSEQHQNNI